MCKNPRALMGNSSSGRQLGGNRIYGRLFVYYLVVVFGYQDTV